MTIDKARVTQIKEQLPTWVSDEAFHTIAGACGDLIRYIDQHDAPPAEARPHSGHDKISFANGIRAAVTWLHHRAASMVDQSAIAILNSAATNLGWDLIGGSRFPGQSPPAHHAQNDATEIERRLRECDSLVKLILLGETRAVSDLIQRVEKAADTIAALRVENEDAREEIKDGEGIIQGLVADLKSSNATIAAHAKRIEALEGALEGIP